MNPLNPRDWLLLIRVCWNLPVILANIMDEISDLNKKLEDERAPAMRVRTVTVPPGMSPEVAWAQKKDGFGSRPGNKVRVLVDENEDLLAVMLPKS